MYKQSLNKTSGTAGSKSGHHHHRSSKRVFRHGATMKTDKVGGDITGRDDSQSSKMNSVSRTMTRKHSHVKKRKTTTNAIVK